MSTIPGSMFVAPGSCHSSLRKYHQIQKRQQSQEIDIGDISPRGEVDVSPSQAITTSPIASPVGSPIPPLSPLNKICKYFRQFSNPGAIQESTNLQGSLQGTAPPDSEQNSP